MISDCPSNETVETGEGMSTASASWTAPTASDNSGEMPTLNQTMGEASESDFSIGSHKIEYTAEDSAGNTATCCFYVFVLGKWFKTYG